MRLRRGLSVLLPVLALLAVAAAESGRGATLRPVAPLAGPLLAREVLDGDTLVLATDLGPRTVRLIGIDAPEMRPGGAAALEARERLRGLVAGNPLWVEVGAEREDRYGRLLAYLYVVDPGGRWELGDVRGEQVNLLMVEGGWVDTLTIPPNDAYAELYAAARAEAARVGAGLWGGAGSLGATDPEPGGGAAPRLHCALVNPSTANDSGAEWVSVMLPVPLDTSGYYLWDEGSRSTFRLPDGPQPAGELRIVNPGQGVWNNSGDTIFLMVGGRVVDSWTYGRQSAREDRIACRSGPQ